MSPSIRSERPVFIVGMPRSGTTILADAISCHEDFFWFSNYQNRFPAIPFVSALNRIVEGQVIGVNLRSKRNKSKGITGRALRLLPSLSEAHHVWGGYCGRRFTDSFLLAHQAPELQAVQFRQFIEKVGRFHGKSILFHKFTGPSRIEYLNSIFPDARYIHLVRDPRAVVSSLLKSGFWEAGGGYERPWWSGGLDEAQLQSWDEQGRSPIALAAMQWEAVVRLTLDEQSLLLPDQLHQVRYEDFVANPHGLLEGVFEFCGVEESRRPHSYLDKVYSIGNMNRKFRRHFSADDEAVIRALTARTAARLGYKFD